MFVFWTLGKLLRSKGKEESEKCSPGDTGVHVRFTRKPQIMWLIRLKGECVSLFLRKTLLFQQSVCVCQLAVFLFGYTRLFLFLFPNPMSEKLSLHQVTISEVRRFLVFSCVNIDHKGDFWIMKRLAAYCYSDVPIGLSFDPK